MTPSIIVAPFDGTGTTMWSDSWSGHLKVESNLLEKLMPHIESTYRASDQREKRTLQGFSMGGFGALKIGFKHPQLFSKIISLDGAIHSWKTISNRRKKITEEVFKTEEAFDQNSPWKSSERYVSQADQFPMKVFVVEAWVKDYNQNFKAHLEQLALPFEYIVTDCGHDMNCMMKQGVISRSYES